MSEHRRRQEPGVGVSASGGKARDPLVIVGDAMLDVDVVGDARRLSPEAPVPVLDRAAEFRRPGGAALAAVLAARGRRPVVLIAPLADDPAAAELRQLLPAEVELIPLDCTGATAVKTRFRAGDHPLVRVDAGAAKVDLRQVPAAAERVLASAAGVLVSDYGRGCTADPRVRELLRRAASGRPLVWDPHPRGEVPVPGTLLATPNEAELLARTGGSAAGLGGSVGRGPRAAVRLATALARGDPGQPGRDAARRRQPAAGRRATGDRPGHLRRR